MENDKKDTKNNQRDDRQAGRQEQGSNKTAGQRPASQPATGKSDDSMQEALKHVGHRGGKTTDFGSTSYEED